MNQDPKPSHQLFEKLENLLLKQESMSAELKQLQQEIMQLRMKEFEAEKPSPLSAEKAEPEKLFIPPLPEPAQKESTDETRNPNHSTPSAPAPKQSWNIPQSGQKSDLEKFIGENLISKLGIVILVLGVGVGAKYAIDHEMISPLTRIILGYLMGLGLLGFAIKLKEKYENFSAVLLSGSMAILYFITFLAYDFYDLIPQAMAFGMMVVFTGFTVAAALSYDKQVIALIGLVGAYGVPFLLSDGSGRVQILFSYMAIINSGVLAIAIRKYWKALYYSAFGLSWIIFFTWYALEYDSTTHFSTAAVFLSIFFSIFYSAFLGNKLLKKAQFDITDIMLLLSNSFIFYGIGYALLSGHDIGKYYLGMFTLGNAAIHFAVSTLIYKQKLADRNLFYPVSALVLTFITIAIPVQLDGNWVTLLWAAESALLFTIGRTRRIAMYEKLSYALMLLACVSIAQDWTLMNIGILHKYSESSIVPVFNIFFLTSLLFTLAFGVINYVNRDPRFSSPLETGKRFQITTSILLPAVFLASLYFLFSNEINTYWNQVFWKSEIAITDENDPHYPYYINNDLTKFKEQWLINYTLIFLAILSFVNIQKIKNVRLAFVNLGFNAFAILYFLTAGLFSLSMLRAAYLHPETGEYFHKGVMYIAIRYVTFTSVAVLLWTCYRYMKSGLVAAQFRIFFDLGLHITFVWVASSELIHWMDMGGSKQSYKLGLSILWGVYSLLLIAYGIWKGKKPLRIGAIALFAVTLIKLFVYDIAHLDTISRTIVLVSLGGLLLIISFLYNKYKNIISPEIEN